MADICRGKIIVQFMPSYITSLLQTGACRNPRSSVREHAPLVGETIIAASSRLELCFLHATRITGVLG